MNHHYVPEWYQKQFLDSNQSKYYYFDKKSEEIKLRPVKYCFCEEGLYSIKYFTYESDSFEKQFFGSIDSKGANAVRCIANNTWETRPIRDCIHDFIAYIGSQYLRTPKGMFKLRLSLGDDLFKLSQQAIQNGVLDRIRVLNSFYGVLWIEGVWEVVSAIDSDIKFIVSDTPITIYNQGSFPGSEECLFPRDPEIQWIGTHTIFALDNDKCLIISNKEYFNIGHQNYKKSRTNPGYFRDTIFSFLDVIRGRELNRYEVATLNYIIKTRATRYIASSKKEWLYPENEIKNRNWSKLFNVLIPKEPVNHLFGERIARYSNGTVVGTDYLGRKIPNSKEKLKEMEEQLEEIIRRDNKSNQE
jgi:hypothetical protein